VSCDEALCSHGSIPPVQSALRLWSLCGLTLISGDRFAP
jgi:hypothetical protein